jgi:hypothetical protein
MRLPSVTARLLLRSCLRVCKFRHSLSQKPFNRIIHMSSQCVVKFHFVSGSRLFFPQPARLRAVAGRDPLKSEYQNQSRRKIARRAAPNR